MQPLNDLQARRLINEIQSHFCRNTNSHTLIQIMFDTAIDNGIPYKEILATLSQQITDNENAMSYILGYNLLNKIKQYEH